MKLFKVGTEHKVLDTIRPAAKFVPDWYKKMPVWLTGKREIVENEYGVSISAKACVPFLDSFTYGYMIETAQDIEVVANVGGADHYVKWVNNKIQPVEGRDQTGLEDIPCPEGFSDYQWVWLNHFNMQTPPGYSLLITHPLNRSDLPFYTLSGIVDADDGIQSGRYPFYLKQDWEGIIPKGTPIMQLIPIKRDNWQIARDDDRLVALGNKLQHDSASVIRGFYKKTLWKRKKFI